jgi:hypothetical protein
MSSRYKVPTEDDFPKFQEWWKLYPSELGRKVGKQDCLYHWRIANLEPHGDRIINALKLWIIKWRKDRFKYMNAPYKWLHSGYFENPPEEKALFALPTRQRIPEYCDSSSDDIPY